ncbi:rod shape-determining protein RodA [Iodidimonas gelatinilytica]|uniref:Rod shape-determining protein RodA n=1 Tax=Iodidimonas gelatinilytica TaxID=1236966 RepID=A0A5A7MNE1_9PROT|nr:DUF4399 domain-containing protein [Iodidimonas gelatinilytica]GEQ96409.1 rod shape-determining protein RodA [Iodidimonas gelatinilytica]
MAKGSNTKSIGAALAVAVSASLSAISGPAVADHHKASENPAPRAYIVNLEDKQTVTSPVLVIFGLENMGVAPAGVDKPGTGHHHLLINAELSDEDMAYSIPADDQHKHFGGGQTQTTLDLEPGTYTLQLVMGDANHVPLDPPVMSEKITITVK